MYRHWYLAVAVVTTMASTTPATAARVFDPGMELGLQRVANDDDGGEDANGGLRVAWFPNLHPMDPGNKHRIRLADEPSPAVLLRVDREITLDRCTMTVRGAGELIGEPVVVRDGERTGGRVITVEIDPLRVREAR